MDYEKKARHLLEVLDSPFATKEMQVNWLVHALQGAALEASSKEQRRIEVYTARNPECVDKILKKKDMGAYDHEEESGDKGSASG